MSTSERHTASWSRAAGLVLGYGADGLFGDPRSWHPVSGFGMLAGSLEHRLYADNRAAGTLFTAALVGGAAAVGVGVDRATCTRPLLHTAFTALATWIVLGGRSLGREAGLVDAHLQGGDIAAAREQVTHLVGRDPSRMDRDGVARAAVESVAENSSDAVVAPLFWGALAGSGGMLGYRAANTLDAMVGHRSPQYNRFGWASARLDDLLNAVPARLTAGLAAAAAPAVDGRPGRALAVWMRDAADHPSPNAGPVEAAFAGALGITLGGVNRYGDVLEDRGMLGDGPVASPADISRAARLARLVGACALSLAVIGATSRRRRPR